MHADKQMNKENVPVSIGTQGIKHLQFLTLSARRQAEGGKLMEKSGESNSSALHETLPGETSAQARGDPLSCDIYIVCVESLHE